MTIKGNKLNDLVHAIKDRCRQEAKAMEAFKMMLDESPSRAMQGSTTAFRSAARLEVYGMAISALTDDDGKPELVRVKLDGEHFNTIDNLAEYSQSQVNRRAGNPPRSSSPSANLMEQEYLAAWSDIIEFIRFG